MNRRIGTYERRDKDAEIWILVLEVNNKITAA